MTNATASFKDQVFHMGLRVTATVDTDAPHDELGPWKWNWPSLLSQLDSFMHSDGGDVAEISAYRPDGLTQIARCVPKHENILLGCRIFYAPWGVSNSGDEGDAGWYIQQSDDASSSDALGPYDTIDQAVDALKAECFHMPWVRPAENLGIFTEEAKGKKAEFDEWLQALPADGPMIIVE